MKHIKDVIRATIKEIKLKSGSKNNVRFTQLAKDYAKAYKMINDAANVLEGPGSSFLEYGLTYVIEVELASLIYSLTIGASPSDAISIEQPIMIDDLTELIFTDYANDEETAEKLTKDLFKYNLIEYV
jgi:hypothetical protein